MSDRSDIVLAVLSTLELLGVSSCELTGRQAAKRFGSWFVQAVKRGELRPSRIGARTAWYKVADIIEYESRGRALAAIQTQNTQVL